MSIYSNKGKVEISGAGGDVLTDLSMIIYALKDAGIPEEMIETAVETGFETVHEKTIKRKNFRKVDEEKLNRILKKLGLED